MDFRFGEKEEAFRRELEDFVKRELSPDWVGFAGGGGEYATDEGWAITRQVAKKLAERGWLTMAWPKEYGGRGASPAEQLLYTETMAYHGVPGLDMGIGGVSWVGPSLMLFGTEEQKREHLSKIAMGERFWCTGYSEPNAGSDLAGLQCRAVEDGDDFVLNGQKVWTSAAHRADWCWLAVRTDSSAPRHKGISLLTVDMRSPGITVNPLMMMSGVTGFCEVFFDEVRIPKANLVGEKNRGWYHLVVALDFERTLGISFTAGARRLLAEITNYAKETGVLKNPIVRDRLVHLSIECEVSRLLCYRVAWLMSKGVVPTYEASMVKNFAAELSQRVAQAGMQLAGLYSQLERDSSALPLNGLLTHSYLRAVGRTIEGGTSEINRGIIAVRGLGLPRK